MSADFFDSPVLFVWKIKVINVASFRILGKCKKKPVESDKN